MITDAKNKSAVRWWPSPQDYNEAVQNPHMNLFDEELRSGLVHLDHLGLPRPVTGAFASVYRMKCGNRDVALRCFLKDITDQERRYALVSDFVQYDELPCTISFEFLTRGIQIGGRWLPVLKMEWVEGLALDQYILANLHNARKLSQLAANFLEMMRHLYAAGVAHGDLQHGNILVLPNRELRLVDYDGMFVPSMSGMTSHEIGHRNYQHPDRTAEHFGDFLDNFSAWVIYTSIVGLQLDPALWDQLAAGDDCLLFNKSDFVNPSYSPAFSAFECHTRPELRSLGRFLRAQLKNSPMDVPELRLPVPKVNDLVNLPRDARRTRSGPRVMPASPDWLNNVNSDALTRKSAPPQTISSSKSVPVMRSLPSKFCPSEPELLLPVPRRVRHKQTTTHLSPLACQMCAFFVTIPSLCMFSYFLSAMTVDLNLLHHGRYFPGMVTSASTIESIVDDTPVTSLHVGYTYQANGQLYSTEATGGTSRESELKPGTEISVYALPKTPEVCCSIFEQPGDRFTGHLLWAAAMVLLNVVMELSIWLPAMYDKSFARNGTATGAEILSKTETTDSDGDKSYWVKVKYDALGMNVEKTFPVTPELYNRLQQGQVVSLLYKPEDIYSAMLYTSCSYEPYPC